MTTPTTPTTITMTPRLVLFKQTGECSTTPKDPVAEVAAVSADLKSATLPSGDVVDLTETVECILHSDDWRGVTTSKWSVIEVMLPEWLTTAEWVRRTVCFKYAVGRGVQLETWPERWVRRMLDQSPEVVTAVAKLLNADPARMRSDFRKSLRERVVAWMDEESPQYASPLSPKQVACVVYNAWEVQRNEASLYRLRGCFGVKTRAVAVYEVPWA